ncbi:Uncharacterised protein [Enterococcus hirae]|nr:Uncharacterised protein [Enterococcus hirae]VEE77280.1 Uncharacterised protein [Enterococcus hirae]
MGNLIIKLVLSFRLIFTFLVIILVVLSITYIIKNLKNKK